MDHCFLYSMGARRRRNHNNNTGRDNLGTKAGLSEFCLFAVLMTAQSSDARKNLSVWWSCVTIPNLPEWMFQDFSLLATFLQLLSRKFFIPVFPISQNLFLLPLLAFEIVFPVIPSTLCLCIHHFLSRREHGLNIHRCGINRKTWEEQ